jgi:UDP-3-O-[3-hydroxymyristoyl] glucosamine N-acyltransferase
MSGIVDNSGKALDIKEPVKTAKPVGIYVVLEVKNPNYSPSGILIQAANRVTDMEARGKLVRIGDGCQIMKEAHIGNTVYFRPGAVVEVLGGDCDETLQLILAESSIHCYTV